MGREAKNTISGGPAHIYRIFYKYLRTTLVPALCSGRKKGILWQVYSAKDNSLSRLSDFQASYVVQVRNLKQHVWLRGTARNTFHDRYHRRR